MGSAHGQGVFEAMAVRIAKLQGEHQIAYGAAVELLALLVESLRQETDWDTVDDVRSDLLEDPLVHSALVVSGWYEGQDVDNA